MRRETTLEVSEKVQVSFGQRVGAKNGKFLKKVNTTEVPWQIILQ
jgi:hypothetical protein